MDPTETLARIRTAIKAGEFEKACRMLEELDKWLSLGGFYPDDWDQHAMRRLAWGYIF